MERKFDRPDVQISQFSLFSDEFKHITPISTSKINATWGVVKMDKGTILISSGRKILCCNVDVMDIKVPHTIIELEDMCFTLSYNGKYIALACGSISKEYVVIVDRKGTLLNKIREQS